MFQGIKNKIEIFIIFAAAFLITLVTISIGSTFRISLTNDFINHSVQSAEQLNNNIKLNLTSFETVANLLTHNTTIIEAMSTDKYNIDVIPILDSVAMTNLNIAGTCLYGVNGINYYSSTVQAPPPLDFILKNEIPDDFVQSADSTTWILREHTIKEYKNYTGYYRSANGLFSFVSKLRNESNELLGYFLIDIPINNIYSFPMNKDNIFLNNTSIYILNEQNKIAHTFKQANNNDEAFNPELITNKDITLPIRLKNAVATVSELENTNTKTVVYTSFRYIKNKFYELIVILFVLDSLFILLVILLVKPLSKSIYKPLQALYSKMKGIHKLIQ